MGGKRLKFPSRQKYVDPSKDAKFENKEEKPLDDEEHKKRMEMLKNLGLIKEESKESS